MKKFILAAFLVPFLLAGCEQTKVVVGPNISTSPYQRASQGSVKLVTEKNLKNWIVTMQPDFSLTTKYTGNGITSDETVSFGGIQGVEHGDVRKGKYMGISFGPNPNGMIVYDGNVRVTLTWRENGKNESGYAIFHVRNTK